MIRVPRGNRVWACSRPVDLRKGFRGLAVLVMRELGGDLLTGDLFVFMSRDRTLVKVLRWDGDGLCLYSKRRARGRFAPLCRRREAGAVRLSREDLDALLSGADITRDPRWRN